MPNWAMGPRIRRTLGLPIGYVQEVDLDRTISWTWGFTCVLVRNEYTLNRPEVEELGQYLQNQVVNDTLGELSCEYER